MIPMSNRIGFIGAITAMAFGLSGGIVDIDDLPETYRGPATDRTGLARLRRPIWNGRHIANLFAAPVTTSQRRTRKNRRRANAAGDKQAFTAKH